MFSTINGMADYLAHVDTLSPVSQAISNASNLLRSKIMGFTERVNPGSGYGVFHDEVTEIFAINELGYIFSRLPSTEVFTGKHVVNGAVSASSGNGIIIDQKGRLLYAGLRYLGMYDPDAAAGYSTGTLTATNGQNTLVGSGTVWIADMVGKCINIGGFLANVSSFTDATHITVGDLFNGVTGSGKTYEIHTNWVDAWKDFGTSVEYDNVEVEKSQTPMECYESDVFIGRKNKVCVLHTSDDSLNGDSLPGFTMPTKFRNQFIKSNVSGVLLGFNNNNKGVLVLWDGLADRAIAPWIKLSEEIYSCVQYAQGWIVVGARTIFYTNGYSVEKMYSVKEVGTPDIFHALPTGCVIFNDLLFIANTNPTFNIAGISAGINVFDLNKKCWNKLLINKQFSYNDAFVTALFIDNESNIYNGFYYDGEGAFGVLQKISAGKAMFISKLLGEGSSKKIAQAIRLVLSCGVQLNQTVSQPTGTVEITAKIASSTRTQLKIAICSQTSTTADKVRVDGSLAMLLNDPAMVGDEVTFFGESGNAGETRHIISIASTGTSSEEWTLDIALPATVKLNEYLEITPFQKISSISFNSKSIPENILFDIKNNVKARKFYLKFIIKNAGLQPIEITDAQFIYDDLGYF
jgi:hypothetical protein